MKLVIFSAIAVALVSPAMAQTATAPAAPAAPMAAAAKFTLDMPIETLMADPAAKAAMEAAFPGMSAHPAYDQFKSLSIKALQPMAGGAITDEAVAKAAALLAEIK